MGETRVAFMFNWTKYSEVKTSRKQEIFGIFESFESFKILKYLCNNMIFAEPHD